MLRRQTIEWLYGYVRFLARSAWRQPGKTVRSLPRWTLYSFLPHLTPSRGGARVHSCTEAAEAARAFFRDGYVVLSDALTGEEVVRLRHAVESKAEEVVRMEKAGALPGRNTSRQAKRYSFGDYGPCPEWEHLSRNERVLAVLRAIWQGRDFAAWKAGGDFVMPGGETQPIHSDFGWSSAGEEIPGALVVDYYVTEVRPECGPIRYVPGTARFPPPGRLARRLEPEWMQRSVITGHPGFALIRDPRAWHGGTANTSSGPRYMPDVIYVRRDEPLADLWTRLGTDPSRVDWIAEFPNAHDGAQSLSR